VKVKPNGAFAMRILLRLLYASIFLLPAFTCPLRAASLDSRWEQALPGRTESSGAMRVFVRGIFSSILFLVTWCHAQESASPVTLTPGDNLIIQGIPPIPVTIAERANRYTEFRSAAVFSWHPRRREMLIGTRFVATKEAGAHDEYKGAITRAKAADTVLTVCFQDGWVNAPHRALRNRTLEMWEAAGCPPAGKRPGEGDILATNAITGATKRRYTGSSPVRDDRGTIVEMSLWAGQGVDAIRDIPSAGELVARLWKECLEAA